MLDYFHAVQSVAVSFIWIWESQRSRAWKGPLEVTLYSPLLEEDHLDHIAHTQMAFECLQGQRLHNLPGQLVPVLDHPQSNKCFLIFRGNVLCSSSCPLSLVPSLHTTQKILDTTGFAFFKLVPFLVYSLFLDLCNSFLRFIRVLSLYLVHFDFSSLFALKLVFEELVFATCFLNHNIVGMTMIVLS